MKNQLFGYRAVRSDFWWVCNVLLMYIYESMGRNRHSHYDSAVLIIGGIRPANGGTSLIGESARDDLH